MTGQILFVDGGAEPLLRGEKSGELRFNRKPSAAHPVLEYFVWVGSIAFGVHVAILSSALMLLLQPGGGTARGMGGRRYNDHADSSTLSAIR